MRTAVHRGFAIAAYTRGYVAHATPAGQDGKVGLKNIATGAMQASAGDKREFKMTPRLNVPADEIDTSGRFDGEDPHEDKHDALFNMPQSMKDMKTMKLPADLPKNEGQMQANPVMGQLMNWFSVPLIVCLFITCRFCMDPFNDGENEVHPTQRKDHRQPVHKAKWGDTVDESRVERSDVVRRKQLRAELGDA